MRAHRFLNVIVLMCVVASLVMTGSGVVLAQPQASTNEAPARQDGSLDPQTGSIDDGVVNSRAFDVQAAPAAVPANVPHYFGPWPNWALSPTRVPDIAVAIAAPLLGGTQATATATVDPQTGAVTGFAITNPGSGYASAPSVTITGAGTAASGTAVIGTGIVNAVTVNAPGGGYTAPTVTISGGGASTPATAKAYGGVDSVTISDGSSGYTNPTVEFGLPQGPNGITATGHAIMLNGTITAVVVDYPGSGYSAAPTVTILNGNSSNPVSCRLSPATAARAEMIASQDAGRLASDAAAASAVASAPAATCSAVAAATLSIQSVVVDPPFGVGYTSVPSVVINDTAPGTGTGALATASIATSGAIVAINVTTPGSGYISKGIRKFQDPLPGLCYPGGALAPAVPNCPASGKYIPVGVAEAKTYTNAGVAVAADEYVIGLIQYRTSFSSDLPNTLVRGYVQLETPANAAISQHWPVTNELMDGTKVPVMNGATQWLAVTPPQWLGPTIVATKNKPVRIVFRNLLPLGAAGNLFLPVDTTLMGSGMGPMSMTPPMDNGSVTDEVRNPMCTDNPQLAGCFKNNRATLHLHGGTTPWISDGTAHQWITPAGENTQWPQGVSVANVPDMGAAGCDAANDGCQTFYYTNQQSARLLFYHDHAWGITRLNVYAGEAAGYLIGDDTEAALVNSLTIPGLDAEIPLVIQDRTFVPSDKQMYDDPATGSYGQDPTWNKAKWGGEGSFWYHHVYMPAQNPGDPSGMSAYGRWMYGPYFWPPATPMYGTISNPYYNPACNVDDPATWQYQTDPFCEPALMPGTPNISVGMEQFNDTPIVNGVAYPTVTLQPKTYRLRMLNAANDRFFNFQWYVADPTTASTNLNKAGAVIGGTEVALDPASLAAAQLDPNAFPVPVQGAATAGPDWIAIGSEGGFLPAPAVIDGQQPTTWIVDPTRFDVGNVDLHSLLLAPAERADVIVDFSKFAGKTLILYNDAPAAFPARVSSYDYYTGAPDLSPVGAPTIVPGFGPNTRTIMQVKIAAAPAAPAFDLAKLQAAFAHKTDGSGVFESGQHPIIVGQAAYNSAYGTTFAASSNCNLPGSIVTRCDGLVRVNDYSTFGFNTLAAPTAKMTFPVEPKAIHDEMNATTFDEYGRMQANLGIEAQPPTPGLQNVTLYPFVNPATELIDGTNLPKSIVTYDANGKVVTDVKMTPISTADGTQIWRITHNGVDTHPIHFHLFDVQIVNRVTWDNIIIPTEPYELGWKDTVRMSPLEDTIVALRPLIPQLPWDLPNAIRMLNPMMPAGSTTMFNNVLPDGTPSTAIVNQLVNFGWEYVYHCHILSHEEMDMMRPVSLAMPPNKPDGVSFNSNTGELTWNDNSFNETSFVVQMTTDCTTWSDLATIQSPLDQPNTHGVRSWFDSAFRSRKDARYRIVAKNTVGYGGGFPGLTLRSISDTAPVAATPLLSIGKNGLSALLTWPQVTLDASGSRLKTAVTSYEVWRSTKPYFGPVATPPPGPYSLVLPPFASPVSATDGNVLAGTINYYYLVRAVIDSCGGSAPSNVVGAFMFQLVAGGG